MKDIVARLDEMAEGWLCNGLPDAELPREAARLIERLRNALLIGHTYAECCPTPASPNDRDADCPACEAMGPRPTRSEKK